jgi:hypothetical protein
MLPLTSMSEKRILVLKRANPYAGSTLKVNAPVYYGACIITMTYLYITQDEVNQTYHELNI